MFVALSHLMRDSVELSCYNEMRSFSLQNDNSLIASTCLHVLHCNNMTYMLNHETNSPISLVVQCICQRIIVRSMLLYLKSVGLGVFGKDKGIYIY